MKNKKKQDRASEFNNLDNKVDSYDLIYEIKTEWQSPKYFRDYQNSIALFKNLRHGNVNPKKVLKNNKKKLSIFLEILFLLSCTEQKKLLKKYITI